MNKYSIYHNELVFIRVVKMERKNLELKDSGLEKTIVVLSPIEYSLSKMPLIGRLYIRMLEEKYQKLLPEYQHFTFK